MDAERVAHMSLGPFEIGVLLVVAALVFGPAMFVRAGGAMGRSVSEFKKAVKEEDEEEKEEDGDSRA